MYKWNKFRVWLNKNDGKYYQVDNQNLNIYEVTGYLSLIFALVIYLFHDKAGFQPTWLGWLCFIIGCTTLFIGIIKRINNKENT